MDFVLFSNYERQVEALLAGHIDIAWNTNVAWIRTQRRSGGTARALATRDTDLVFQTLMIGRAGSGLSGLAVAEGARGSPSVRATPVRRGSSRRTSWPVRASRPTTSTSSSSTPTSASTATPAAPTSTPCAPCSTTTPTSPRSGINTWQALTAAGDDTVADLEVVWESETYNHCNFTHPRLARPRARRGLDHALAGHGLGEPRASRILELEGLTPVEACRARRATDR